MNIQGLIGVLIPMMAIVLGIGCAMLAMYFQYRNRRELLQQYHLQRMAAIEKGIELPPLPEEYFSGGHCGAASPARARRTGLILLFLGIAITLGLWGGGGDGSTTFWWGLVPIGLGVAFLLAAWFEARESHRGQQLGR